MRLVMVASIVAALLVVSPGVCTSEEGGLSPGGLRFEVRGNEETGLVVVDIMQGTGGVQECYITAFGKSYQLSDSQLKALGKGPYDAVQYSYESGRKNLVGRTIHIRLGLGFIFRWGYGSKTIVIDETGNVEVRDPQ
jgi:hypothetical protein